MTVELSALHWPAAIVEASGDLRECNPLWKARFGSCEDLASDFPEAAQQLSAIIERDAPGDSASPVSVIVRAPGEIAPLRLRFTALPIAQPSVAQSSIGQSPFRTWLVVVEENAEASLPPTWPDEDVLREAEREMDGVAMRLQARNWRAFFHDAAAGKALIGLHGETIEVNGALCRLLDRSEGELLNLYARDLRHPEDLIGVEEHYQSALAGGPPVAGIEARYLHKNGHYVSCLLAVSLIRDSRGRALYFATEVEDISSLRQAEAQLRARSQELELANSELMRSNTDLERFAFVASHDLQEPLRKIRIFGDRLDMLAQQAPADSLVGADLVRYIGVMTKAAQRMQNLVDDLLSYGRLKQRDTPFVAVDLNALWEELREEYEATLLLSGAQLQVEALPTVRGNPFRLRQLFGNLLSNALKFRDEHQPPRIAVRALSPGELPSEQSPHPTAIEVRDNGIGFDAASAETIFEVFARLHGRSRYPGTGIGLSICRRVAREHGGEVRAFSRPGEGASFVVTLGN